MYRLATQTACILTLTLLSNFSCACAAESITSSYQTLTAGPWQERLLPGCEEFTFAMYGHPGELERLKELVAVMREHGLGNGFDPGPAARAASGPLLQYLATVRWPLVCYPGCADMQVKDGRCRLGGEDETVMEMLDRAGVFSAVQLGEWGYYFHNLSCARSWWRDVYKEDFEKQKHLMKPPGLAGYDARPTSRRQAEEKVSGTNGTAGL